MKPIRYLLPLALVLLTACSQTPATPPAGPGVPESPYVPSDPVTEVPNSPYAGDWAWSTSLNCETLFVQGILSIHSFDSTGRGTGAWARCEDTCPVGPEGSGSITLSEEHGFVDIGLYDEFEGEFYSRFFGLSTSGMQEDEQGRNAFASSGNYTICVTTCRKTEVSFVAVQVSATPSYPPFE